jgi:hypothetical protein
MLTHRPDQKRSFDMTDKRTNETVAFPSGKQSLPRWAKQMARIALLSGLLVLLMAASGIAAHAASQTTSLQDVHSVNLSLFNTGGEQFCNNTSTQNIVKAHGVPYIRMPFRDTISDAYEQQCLKAIKAVGALPLVIVHGECVSSGDPFTPDSHWLQTDVQPIFGSAPVLVEYGNEEDLSCNGGGGISIQTYTTSWNSVVSRLKAAFPAYKYVGPVFYQSDPTDLQYFVGHANPRPDYVSWHEYACGPSDSNAHCTQAITNWAQHITANNQAMQNAIGTTIPIIVSEWNLDPQSDSRYGNASFIKPWMTSALKQWNTLTSSGVFLAMIYTLDSHGGNFQLITSSNTLTPEGQVFFS